MEPAVGNETRLLITEKPIAWRRRRRDGHSGLQTEAR